MKNQKLTCTFYIGGKQVEKLTAEQSDKIAKTFGETLSNYYTANPEEFKRIK